MNKEDIPLRVQNLTYRYHKQGRKALDSISFDVKKSSICGVLGPNGAGKSTLLKAALGLLPCEGSALFFNAPLDKNRHKVAYIPQRSTVDWDFPVNVLDVCLMGIYPRIGWFKRIRAKHKEEAMHYLEMVGLEDLANRQIGNLSGGQQQRVFMSRALAQKAELFLLDEPMAGVDQKTQTLLFDIFGVLKAEGKSIVIVHHNLHTAKDNFDDIVLLNQKLVAHGTPEKTLAQDMIDKAYNMAIE